MESQQLIPQFNFGKHQGKSVTEVMAIDPGYIPWCMSQPNLKDKVNVIINLTQQITHNTTSSATPEHNRMQNSFLDKNLQTKLILKSCPSIKKIEQKLKDDSQKFKEEFNEESLKYFLETQIKVKINFEWKNWDIYLNPEFLYKSIYRIKPFELIDSKTTRKIFGELKPSLGDDYSAVLRKMNHQIEITEAYLHSLNTDYSKKKNSETRYGVYVLIIDNFQSESASKEELKQIFKNSNIKVIFMEELFNDNIEEQFIQQIEQPLQARFDKLLKENLNLKEKLKIAEDKIKELEQKESRKLEEVIESDNNKLNSGMDIRAFFGKTSRNK